MSFDKVFIIICGLICLAVLSIVVWGLIVGIQWYLADLAAAQAAAGW